MLKKILLGLFLILASSTNAKVLTVDEILEATCRIGAGDAYGSGSCINFDKEKNTYYILTNAHVVNSENNVKLEFFKFGRKTNPIPGTVVYRKLQGDIDFAIVAVDGKYFGKYPPRVMPIAPRNATAEFLYMKTAGCPEARWATGTEGFILSQDDNQIKFYPPPVGGQSGSGLFIVVKDKDELKTVLKGIVSWRIGGGSENRNATTGYETAVGGAVNIDRVVDVLKGAVAVRTHTLPLNYHPAAQTILKAPVNGNMGYATDGKYYRISQENDHFKITHPDGTHIVSVIYGADLLPIPDRPGEEIPPQENPYDNLPNLDNSSDVEKKLKDIEAKLAIVNKEKAELTDNLSVKTEEIKTLNDKIKNLSENLNSDLEKLTAKVENLEMIVSSQVEEIKLLEQEKSDLIKERDELKKNFAALKEQRDAFREVTNTKEEQVDKLTEERQEVSAKANLYGWLATGSGTTTVGAIIGFIIYIRKRRKQIFPIIGLKDVSDKIDAVESKVANNLKDILDGMVIKAVDETNAQLEKKKEEENKVLVNAAIQNLAKKLEESIKPTPDKV